MPTIPTGQMERELRKLYLRWVYGLTFDSSNLYEKLSSFERRAFDIIERMGGYTASLGALGDFPAPKTLDLSPYAGKIYVDMQQAAIKASIMVGLNSREAARAMFRAGMDKSFRRLERLARTETTNAYWQNAFRSVADLPALVMVWGAEDGPRTCAWCRERDGLIIDSSNLRDHPNGRCTPIPTLRSQVKYRGSISPDGQIYWDPSWQRPTVFQGGRSSATVLA
ncbi:MuF-like minor capsid protein [Microbacterium phage Ixel]|nr:MuF-like minor capsid protein [Microbacterium phage Ixel]